MNCNRRDAVTLAMKQVARLPGRSRAARQKLGRGIISQFVHFAPGMAAAIHHHVPQGYQAGFAENGRIWVYDRVTGQFRRDQPRNVGGICEYYSFEAPAGSRNEKVETEFFGAVDSGGIVAIRRLAEGAKLNDDECETLCWYLSYTMVRGPRFQRMLDELGTAMAKLHARHALESVDDMREMISACDTLTEEERASADPELLFEFAKSEDYVVRLNRDYAIKLMMDHGEDLRRLFADADWIVAHASGDAEFITSDNPLVTVGPVRTFPLTRKSCLLITGNGRRLTHKEMDSAGVHLLNLDTARHCERVVIGGDEAYLRSVVAEAKVPAAAPPIFLPAPSPPGRI